MPPNPEEINEARKRKRPVTSETSMPPSSPPARSAGLSFNMFQFPSTLLRLNSNNQYYSNAPREIDSPKLSAARNLQSFTAAASTVAPTPTMQENIEQIDRAISSHGYQLKATIESLYKNHYTSLLSAAEERASKKLKDKETELNLMAYKNAELEEKLATMTMELRRWKSDTLQLEARFSALHGAWQDYNTTRGIRLEGFSEPVQEGEGESSHVEPNHVEPTKLTCKVCGQQSSIMVLWQCKHLCVCGRCNVTTTFCPICQCPRTCCTEVNLQ